MAIDYNKLAKEIIAKNQYLTLGSTNPDGTAWVSPLCYAYDDKFNFYFVSLPDSKHCQNYLKNDQVSFAIFDSQQMYGEGVGLQIEGKMELVESKNKILKAAAVMFSRKFPYRKIFKAFDIALKNFLDSKTYYFYKITPTKIWMNDPNAKVDIRVEVKL